ncbi:hypothetical protein [Microvirga tunisiensis]|uniref:Uncharacterized protein n=1 Tax=Microvirga tunisiensis TaxID=2108360 RepID=A0A5N7MP16_9HYPH|nr:hypothetical protein [Microvirga tunisiensis]MPR10694.1 hypothetical protein [Microvirga tunisiensis]MPR28767.1 hypothetical protein [Microvirga tunisiensis]
MQLVQDYASRGRSLEKVPTDQLRGEWVALMRAWVTNPHEFRNPQRADIECEFTLRGLEPPYEMVVDEFEAVTRFISEAIENMDDAEKDRINTQIASELVDFLSGEKSRRN